MVKAEFEFQIYDWEQERARRGQTRIRERSIKYNGKVET